MKIPYLMIMSLLLFSCEQLPKPVGLLNETQDTTSVSSECYAIVSKIIEDRKDYFDENEGLVIDLTELSEAEKKCMPTTNGIVASVETNLKQKEAGGDVGTSPEIVVASVETYLKYAEAVSPDSTEFILGSGVETFLKYAEAVGDISSIDNLISFASIETTLKGMEAVGGSIGNLKVATADVETYLKFWEANGGNLDGAFYTRADTDPMLQLNEALGLNGFNFYSSKESLKISGVWDPSLNADGWVLSGTPFWSKSKTLFSYFNMPSTELVAATSAFLAKGFVLSGADSLDKTLMSKIIPEPNSENILTVLDKGVVIDPTIIPLLADLEIATSANAEVVLDKGVVISKTEFDSARKLLKVLIAEGDFTTFDGINDKGFVATKNSIPFAAALISHGLVTSGELLDYGYHIEVLENTIFIRSVEEYLQYYEATLP
jgi:hypothetical protein